MHEGIAPSMAHAHDVSLFKCLHRSVVTLTWSLWVRPAERRRVSSRPARMPALKPDEVPTPVHRSHAGTSNSLHVVFSAECIPAFDWQSVGLFYSFRHIRQQGKITRLLACSDEQLAAYPRVLLEMGPTFVHENMRFSQRFNSDEMKDEFHDQKGKGYVWLRGMHLRHCLHTHRKRSPRAPGVV